MTEHLKDLMRQFRDGGGAQGLVSRTLARHGIGGGALPAGAMPGATSARAPSAPAPGAGAMTQRRTETAVGGRDWWLHVPETLATRPVLVVMLHGCTQSPADFAAGTGMNAAAAERGWPVIWPQQVEAANAMRCWNWFDPTHVAARGGEAEILGAIIDDARKRLKRPGAPVAVAGLSAGGAMAAALAEARPDLVGAIGVHSGLPAGAATSVQAALGAMRQGTTGGRPPLVPALVIHGDADRTVAPSNGEALARKITGRSRTGTTNGRGWTRRDGPAGEFWQVEGLGHAWSGGRPGGSYTDPAGPDATAEMLRFFAERLG